MLSLCKFSVIYKLDVILYVGQVHDVLLLVDHELQHLLLVAVAVVAGDVHHVVPGLPHQRGVAHSRADAGRQV